MDDILLNQMHSRLDKEKEHTKQMMEEIQRDMQLKEDSAILI